MFRPSLSAEESREMRHIVTTDRAQCDRRKTASQRVNEETKRREDKEMEDKETADGEMKIVES
jgi:hypothetical protein